MKKTETDLIQELLKSVEVLGVDATTNVLKVARSNTLTLQDKRVEFVLKMTSAQYLQSIEDIINSHNKSFKRMMALKFSIYYLYDAFEFSFTDLKILFKSSGCSSITSNIFLLFSSLSLLFAKSKTSLKSINFPSALSSI